MDNKIKIFIATCIRNLQAEIALEYSIRSNTESEVEIVWMRNTPKNQTFHGWNEDNWGTGFTPFRWLVPELCNYKGKAIYMDVDVLVLDDIKLLWELKVPENKAVVSLPGNYSVMLFDCEKFGRLISTSPLAEWKQKSCTPQYKGLYNNYVTQLEAKDLVEPLSPEWNSLDQIIPNTKLIHYTRKVTQPWCPYADKHIYEHHARPECTQLWFNIYEKAMQLSVDDGAV